MIEGYKESNLGEIPENWEVKKLGDFLNVNTGSKNAQDSKEDGVYPFFTRSVTTQNIDTYSYNTEALFIAGEGIFKVKYYKGKFDVHQRTYILTSKEGIECSMKFFQNQIQSRILRLVGTSVGSTVQSLRKPIIQNLELIYPPLPEQQKIAEILSTVDAKIDVIDQQITESQELKKGLMQRLLTKGIGHTEFKESLLGEIPVDWVVLKLGDISEIKGRIGYRGYTKLDLVEEGKGALAIGGAQITKQNKLSFSKAVYLDWEKYEESPEIKVEVGNIVFAQRGTLGRVALINFLPEKATINPSMVLIKDIECNERFLFYYLCSSNVQNIVSQISTSTAVPMISQKQIKEFNIGIPSIQEQKKIADILSSVDEKLDVLSEKKTTYQELKKGLMQQLLTGKVRVKV